MNPREEYFYNQQEKAKSLEIKKKYLFPNAYQLLQEIK